jgi:signal transduction histidine kinase
MSRVLRSLAPRTFQARLTIGFLAVVSLTLLLVSLLVLNRLDDYFFRQQEADIADRSATVRNVVAGVAREQSPIRPVVAPDGTVEPGVARELGNPIRLQLIADELAKANVRIRLGLGTPEQFVPALDGEFTATYQGERRPGQERESKTYTYHYPIRSSLFSYVIEITISDPFTFRASALANVTGLLVAIALFALGMAMIVAAVLARRFTTPLRRLTEATRGIAEGDLSRRVTPVQVAAAPAELTELANQFNAMAERLEESVGIIRRDRDRSRDFLADVSHELRTPIAALRTFNELVKEQAANDPEARAEFLEASSQQIDRLDWLAQNLLELSKLDSGLVLLDLRPDDLRAAVESAVDQAAAAASRRGVDLRVSQPDRPIRIRHDAQRIGQVVTNLVGNAVKFTGRGGSVDVAVRPLPEGAEIEVRDTGVGIDPEELPKIFDRFYRGSGANEARGSGSGLGLSIVRSIVDMHGGSVTVESRRGAGSRFVVTLPRDPRTAEDGAPAASHAASTPLESAAPGAPKVADSSSGEGSRLNPGTSP